VIVEPKEGERGLTQRKVGMYQCAKCGMKFPTVISRQRYLLVGEEQLNKIRSDVLGLKKMNQDLEKRINDMTREHEETLVRSGKDADVKRLEGKLEALERHVAYLRKEKGELEEKVSKLR
jgi:hypothetical protein